MHQIRTGAQYQQRQLDRAAKDSRQTLQPILASTLATDLEMQQFKIAGQRRSEQHVYMRRDTARRSARGTKNDNLDLSHGLRIRR